MNNPTPLRPRQPDQNPLQMALDDYSRMERENRALKEQAQELRIQNNSLVAEVNMLSDNLNRCETDRIRLQAVSSTLMGQLMAINAVIADAVKMSIKHGVEAVEDRKDAQAEAELDKAGAEVREILTRSQPVGGAQVPGNEFR